MMKKHVLVISLFMLISALLPAKGKKDNKPMYVSVVSLSVKDKASFFASEVGQLSYGEPVFVLAEKKSWTKIQSIDQEEIIGWVSEKSLTKKKLIASEGNVDTNADELALAGKGFSKAIEGAYSEEYDVSFDVVDEIEDNTVSDDEVLDFLKEGKLNLPE